MFIKHRKQPTLGTVTIVSQNLRFIRPLFNRHDDEVMQIILT